MIRISFLLIMAAGLLAGCHFQGNKVSTDRQVPGIGSADISPQNILADLQFLSADELEGREATRRGEKVAALFLSTELQKYGVSPWPAVPGYLQPVDLKLVRFSEKSQFQLLDHQEQLLHSYVYGQDFTGGIRSYPTLDTTAGMVFAGYGITAPAYSYDDYAKIGVDGKIAVVFYGEPQSEDSNYFAGKKDSPFASPVHKLSNACKHGAIGVIFLSQFEKTYGWERMRSFVQKGCMQLKDETGDDDPRSNNSRCPAITISEKSLGPLLASEKYSADSLLVLLDQHSPLPTFLLNKRARLHWQFEADSVMQAFNVVGMIPGTDANLADEFVGIGAHYDHLGMVGDTVYNGADDNASGTTAILEVARVLARDHRNKRPVLVILHTAEEKGLLGSRYMSEQPGIAEHMIAYINLDMVGGGSADTIYSVGADRISAELQEITEKVNAATVRFIFNYELNNPNNPERVYYRSDQFSYARLGIPTVFFFDYYMKYYHTPADDLDKLNIDKIVRVAELTCQLTLQLANHHGRLKTNN